MRYNAGTVRTKRFAEPEETMTRTHSLTLPVTPEQQQQIQESPAIWRQLDDEWGVSRALTRLGLAASTQRDYRSARALHQESLALRRALGDQWGIAESLEGLAEVARAQGELERAARLFGAASGLREALGTPLPPSDRADRERSMTDACAALGAEAFATAWTAGRALPLEEVIADALE